MRPRQRRGGGGGGPAAQALHHPHGALRADVVLTLIVMLVPIPTLILALMLKLMLTLMLLLMLIPRLILALILQPDIKGSQRKGVLFVSPQTNSKLAGSEGMRNCKTKRADVVLSNSKSCGAFRENNSCDQVSRVQSGKVGPDPERLNFQGAF